MSNFKLNRTLGRCGFCGRQGQDHCSITYPRVPTKTVGGTRRMRVCKECGTLIYKVVVTKEDYQRNQKIEKKIKVILRERREKRNK